MSAHIWHALQRCGSCHRKKPEAVLDTVSAMVRMVAHKMVCEVARDPEMTRPVLKVWTPSILVGGGLLKILDFKNRTCA